MKKLFFLILLLNSVMTMAQDSVLKTTLLTQLKSTHNEEDWFVPANKAVEGLTAEQASWKDGKGNHSVGQLAHHLVFWNERQVAQLKGQAAGSPPASNEETFDAFDKKAWDDIVKRLDNVMKALEDIAKNADEANLQKMARTFATISTHNAYHTGQIIVVRRMQGAWK